MAKLPKATIDVTGLTIKDIMNLDINADINSLSRNDLAKVTGRLISASNKRIRNLAKTELGQMSPAYISRMERGGLFSVKGKNRQQILHEFAEAKGFLNLKTSSRRGWSKVRTEVAESLGVDKSFLSTETKAKKFWKTYREIIDGKNIPDKKTRSRYNSERIQEMLAEKYGQKGGFKQRRSEVAENISKRIDEIYEQEQMNDEMNNTPDFIGEDDDGFYNL